MSNDPFSQNPASATQSPAHENRHGNRFNRSPYDPTQPSSADGSPVGNGTPKKQGLGCWFWGCLGTLVFTMIAMVGLGFASYWFLTGQVAKYTDTEAADIQVVEIDEAEMEALQARIDAFTSQVTPKDEEDAVIDGKEEPDSTIVQNDKPGSDEEAPEEATPEPIQELALTADEINALIAAQNELKGRVFVRIEDGRVFGTVSIPTDMVPGGSGRFFNADAEFDVSMEDGILVVRLVDASVKGERIPDAILDGFSEENLAQDAYKNAENAEMLRKFESIQVRDDSIILKLKRVEPTP